MKEENMKNNFYKLAALGIILSATNCTPKHQNLKITDTYTLQTCDKEESVYFVEMQSPKKSFTGFINQKNTKKVVETKEKFKIGTHTTYEIAKAHFEGIYPTYE